MTDTLFLFASIAGVPIAIRTAEIEAVVRLGDVVPIPLVQNHVRGLAALRSRVLTVIDMEARIFGTCGHASLITLAVIADIAAHSYGFIVDSVSDITQAPNGIQPIRGRIDPAWAPYAAGLVEHDGRSHLLLSLTDFVAAPGTALAA
ncbi:chemotaxis protein CheW [Sphingobium nicotianae]|uniref:Chemotaxis protein CheW n=1 Tax=Sphingobium nicotianae TaxID=2782607 RepID=A0A9X1IT27_9SPHN|nr:chemotaxis protein CheW [Sphingobium nicotianae]MBT2188895.1 chemotaxis protein CheW [Sphingobium nicotianae]